MLCRRQFAPATQSIMMTSSASSSACLLSQICNFSSSSSTSSSSIFRRQVRLHQQQKQQQQQNPHFSCFLSSSSSSAFMLFPPQLVTSMLFISEATLSATKDLPKTPGNQNAFKVLDLDLTKDTTMEVLTKQFKAQAIKCHPDRPGGSNEMMSELNAAYKIAKENLTDSVSKLGEVQREKKANKEYRQMQNQRADKEEELGKSGGIYSAKRVNVVREQMHKFKNAKDLAAFWETFQAETTDSTSRMINRFEVAIEQALHFKKITMLHETSVRERWLRKMFVKNVWETVHELRQELLRKGARSQQQTALAEEMVAFATAIERKLTEDFHRQAQVMIQGQLKVFAGRATHFVIVICGGAFILRNMAGFIYNNSFTKRYAKGFFGHD